MSDDDLVYIAPVHAGPTSGRWVREGAPERVQGLVCVDLRPDWMPSKATILSAARDAGVSV